jgi:transglutaminase-like putative cysteine protease
MINYEFALMSHAFNPAIKEWEWLKDDPVIRVSRERVNNMRERWLTFEEEERLLGASPKWLQEIIVFSLRDMAPPTRSPQFTVARGRSFQKDHHHSGTEKQRKGCSTLR